VNALEDKKAENIVLLDLGPHGLKTDYVITDYFIICTGNSVRQLKALAEGAVSYTHLTLPTTERV